MVGDWWISMLGCGLWPDAFRVLYDDGGGGSAVYIRPEKRDDQPHMFKVS